MAAARPSRAAMSARARVRSFALKKSGDQARLACVCEGERQRDFFFKKKKVSFSFSLSLSFFSPPTAPHRGPEGGPGPRL